MFDKTGKFVGEMKAYQETIYDIYRQFSPNADIYRSFFIDRLTAFVRNQGVGHAFINIAKRESLRRFCLGNVHVISSSFLDKVNPPHIFYRKEGFNCSKYQQSTQNYLDECIKNHKQVERGKCSMDIPMYIEKNTDTNGDGIKRTFDFKIKFRDLFEWL